MRIGERIRQLREARGITVEQLASRLSRGSQTIFRWEWGQTSPRWADLIEIAKVLEIEPSELIEGVDSRSDSMPPASG